MATSHFFIGLGAGIAMLAVPVLTLTSASDLPRRFADWIEGPPPHAPQAVASDAALSRPVRGYRPGDPTPALEVVPTVKPSLQATPVPPAAQPAAVQTLSGSPMRTGVIRSGGAPVPVRRAPGAESLDDPLIADGAPVLVSTAAPLQVGEQQWREVRGLSGLSGWVASSQVAVDGEAPPAVASTSEGASSGPTDTNGERRQVERGQDERRQGERGQGERGKVANTEGAGVVLRNSPNDADRRPAGFLDGTLVTVLERMGSDWVHVRADNGQQGWIPARYLAPPT